MSLKIPARLSQTQKGRISNVSGVIFRLHTYGRYPVSETVSAEPNHGSFPVQPCPGLGIEGAAEGGKERRTS